MSDFALRVIAWQKQHGRHDLPWQNTRNPYAIWVSEIMLQQTQVTAVIGYYQRFMMRFPDIASLSNASQEEVLQYWSGLGYYSRARNLHIAAHTITRDFAGAFPSQFSDILSLSGIGRSTAAAISTFAFDIPQPILDGNVKRVFARHFLIEGWTGTPKIEAQLWQIAELQMPSNDASAYTQGLMDLGATICTRTKPKCQVCPLLSSCGAYLHKRVSTLPTPKPRKSIPLKQTTMLILRCGNEILLEKRPSKGIWGGLWSFPEIGMHEIATEIANYKFGLNVETEEPLEVIQHVFTHFKLTITPQPLIVLYQPKRLVSNTIWLPIEDAVDAAIPAPVRGILHKLNSRPS